jgi:aryl-alcohol dehydrogenase-like predicted oxidoreductase
MAQLAIGWPLGRRFVSSVVIGVKSTAQLASNLAAADWDMPGDLWRSIEERTRPAEDYLSWFNRRNYERMFGCAEFHDNDRLY